MLFCNAHEILITNMSDSHEDSYFLHNLLNLIIFLGPDTFASDLAVIARIQREVNGSKGTTPEAL